MKFLKKRGFLEFPKSFGFRDLGEAASPKILHGFFGVDPDLSF